MPKSKRQRTKALTKVDKKTSDLKQKVVESVREAVDSYATVFAFSFVNMRTNHFKDVRVDFRDSRYAKLTVSQSLSVPVASHCLTVALRLCCCPKDSSWARTR